MKLLRFGEAAALPAFLPYSRFRSALTFGTISAASQLFPPHVAAAALAHPDNCTGEDSSSDLHVVSFVDLIRQATRFANAECRMLNVECFLLSAHFILRSAFFILRSLFPSAFRSAVIKPSTD